MGGRPAMQNAGQQTPAPQPEPRKEKKFRGGFTTTTGYQAGVLGNTGARSTFLS